MISPLRSIGYTKSPIFQTGLPFQETPAGTCFRTCEIDTDEVPCAPIWAIVFACHANDPASRRSHPLLIAKIDGDTFSLISQKTQVQGIVVDCRPVVLDGRAPCRQGSCGMEFLHRITGPDGTTEHWLNADPFPFQVLDRVSIAA